MSGQIKLNLPSGGSKTIAAPDSAATETITLPAGTKTLATVENFTSTGIDDNATSTKLTTTSTGIDVTGTVTTDGIYLGGTGSANLLDDYEEGTWTPTIFSGSHTYTQQYGWYRKIGDVVHAFGSMIVSARGSNTSEFGIGGLPFAETGYNMQITTFGVGHSYGQDSLLNNSNFTADGGALPTFASVEGGVAYIRNFRDAYGSYSVNNLQSSGSLNVAFTYFVNA